MKKEKQGEDGLDSQDTEMGFKEDGEGESPSLAQRLNLNAGVVPKVKQPRKPGAGRGRGKGKFYQSVSSSLSARL